MIVLDKIINMSSRFIAILITCLSLPCFSQFTKFIGPITSTFSDSRSVNFIDINNDDWDDIFISNGKSGGQKDMLYINDKAGGFTEVFDMDLVTQSKPSDGASFADYNQDGHIDAVVSNWYGVMDDLFLNDGNGKLMLNKNAGIASGSYAETAVFCDYNNDGLLDIYIPTSGGSKINHLYKNLGNSKFERITGHKIIEGNKASRAAIWSDLNNDGYSDILITNEGNGTNDIFLGKGGDTYERYTASSIVTKAESSVTASIGDIDNDGDMDIFIGNSGLYAPKKKNLFKNENGVFNAVNNTVLTEGERCSFGSAFSDYDNDGDLDLLVSNGFCSIEMKDQLYQNNGDGSFIDVSHLIPTDNVCSYGCAWGDANNDGFLDIMIANCKNDDTDIENPNTLLINTPNDNHWIKIKLVGIESNTNGIGARIYVKAKLNGAEISQLREISGQTGYSGQNSLTAHFGMLDAETADSVIIRWPNGKKQWLTNLEINKMHTIIEGTLNSTDEIVKNQEITFDIKPNPASKDSQLDVSIHSALPTMATLMISTMDGRLIDYKNLKLISGLNNETIKMTFPHGRYVLILKTNSSITSKSIFIHD